MNKLISALLSLLFIAGVCYSEQPDTTSEPFFKSNIGVDFAWDPECKRIPEYAHFSSLKDPYEFLELRSRLNLNHEIKTPLGTHWLLAGAHLNFLPSLEVTPISIRPVAAASFTPVPFLEFSAGASVGTGWKMPGVNMGGMRRLDTDSSEYSDLDPFRDFYYDFWGQALFQFDTGAIFPGEWNHVVMQAYYNAGYKALSCFKAGDFGKWMGTENFANGWQYEGFFLVGYDMPLRLYRSGLMVDAWGHFNDSDYGDRGRNSNFNGNFTYVSICPFAQVHMSKKDDLTILAEFSSRRSFWENHTKYAEEANLHYKGYEWYFVRIALRYVHTFTR